MPRNGFVRPLYTLVRRYFPFPFSTHKVEKGTIRFPLSRPVPAKLIECITKLRAKETAEDAKAKAAASKKR